MTHPAPPAITHVALTVGDLTRSISWYTDVLGAAPAFVGEMLAGTPDHYELAVWTTPNLGLHCFAERAAGEFDVRRPGLDHLAFECESRDDLLAWRDHLDALGVEHGDVLDEPYGSGLAFRDPDGIALELFASARRVKPPER